VKDKKTKIIFSKKFKKEPDNKKLLYGVLEYLFDQLKIDNCKTMQSLTDSETNGKRGENNENSSICKDSNSE
jgi:hypothetical protein